MLGLMDLENYLIQHSAGSGKSNTIAWTAHRLAELHKADNENVFDSVIVITDRRVLDRQLSDTVASFAQVAGVVKHVESSAELKTALESGTKVIASTLVKFPVIVEAIDQTAGKKFAVIIDEAHFHNLESQLLTYDRYLRLMKQRKKQLNEKRLLRRLKICLSSVCARVRFSHQTSAFCLYCYSKAKDTGVVWYRRSIVTQVFPILTILNASGH